MQGRIPRLNRRFLALSDCQEHWRNVASHCGYTQGGRPCGEADSLTSGGWRDYCKQQRRRELSWLAPERCDMQAVRHSHQQWAPAIVYSQRSKEIVTCSYDGTVRMWLDDSSTDRNYPCTRVLTTEEGEGFSVVAIAPETAHVAPDSMLLAAGSEYGNVHVWCGRLRAAHGAQHGRRRWSRSWRSSPAHPPTHSPARSLVRAHFLPARSARARVGKWTRTSRAALC